MKTPWASAIIATLMMVPICTTPAIAASIRCEIAQKYQCAAGEPCQPVATPVWNIIDFDRKTYARCDKAGCDTHPAEISKSGEFAIIALPGRGTFAKLHIESHSFVEVASIGLIVYVSYGRCSP